MRRISANILIFLAAFVLQYSLMPEFPYLQTAPNLSLILCLAIALGYGDLEGMLYGLWAGLLTDLFYGKTVGFFMLVFLMLGFGGGFFSRYYTHESFAMPVVLCFIGELFFNFMLYFFYFYVKGRVDIWFYLRSIIIPEIIMTLLFELLLHKPFLSLNRYLQRLDLKKR